MQHPRDRVPVLFVHIMKNSGNSIKRNLVEDNADKVTLHPLSNRHLTVSQIETEQPGSLRRYRSFCVVRNPYARLLSMYNFQIATAQAYEAARQHLLKTHGKPAENLPYDVVRAAANSIPGLERSAEFNRYLGEKNVSDVVKKIRRGATKDRKTLDLYSKLGFKGWAKAICDPEKQRSKILLAAERFLGQSQWSFISIKGKPAVERILRQENLTEEYAAMARELGIDGNLGRYNVSGNGGDYRDAYDEETRKMVEPFIREDLEKLGYEF
nr:sulfotransferase family protein [Oceanusvirus sp.]